MKRTLFMLAIVILTACSNKDACPKITDDSNQTDESNKTDGSKITLNYQTLTLIYGDVVNLVATPEKSSYMWSSSDNYVASVSSDGVLTANHIGEASISVTDENSQNAICQVNVVLYVEPVLDFGATQAAIKSKEKRELLSGDLTQLLYRDSQNNNFLYQFENGKMSGVTVTFPTTPISKDDLFKFVEERYDYLGKNLFKDNNIIFYGRNGIALQITTDKNLEMILSVIYVEYTD